MAAAVWSQLHDPFRNLWLSTLPAATGGRRR